MSFEKLNQLLQEVEKEILSEEEDLKIMRSLNDDEKDKFSEKHHEARQYTIALRRTLRQLNEEILEAIRNNNQNP